jgi:putative flippase GtrA
MQMTGSQHTRLREIIAQLGKFTLVGAFGTVVHYAILIVLVEKAGAGPVVGSSAGAVAGAFVNYFLNYYFTFRSKRRHIEAIVQFYVVAATGFLLNAIFMWLLANLLGVYYLLAQLITTGLVLLWNFWINRTWTFRSRTLESDSNQRLSG